MPKASEPEGTEPEVCKPVPLSETVLIPTPVGTDSEPEAAPIVLGVKLIVYAHEAPPARLAPHVVETRLYGALTVAADTDALVLPVLVNVAVWFADVELTV